MSSGPKVYAFGISIFSNFLGNIYKLRLIIGNFLCTYLMCNRIKQTVFLCVVTDDDAKVK